MRKTRVIIETSTENKDTLDSILKERGTTLTEWFNEKIGELAIPDESIFDDDVTGIRNLSDLEDSTGVLADLKALDWSFSDANTSYLSHSLHPYPAKFIPQIPRALIRKLSLRGETVWNPFGGSGTTALEALLLGRQAISSDLNPIASLVGTAKTSSITKEEHDRLLAFIEKLELLSVSDSGLQDFSHRHYEDIKTYVPQIPNMEKWFHENAIIELAFIRWQIENIDNKTCKIIANAALSKIIIKASYQDGETRYASKPRKVELGAVLRYFTVELNSAVNKILRLTSFLKFRQAAFFTDDLREKDVVQPNSVDLIVSSPPYPNATDYTLYHRFRLFWLGYDPIDLAKKEIGSHLRHQKEATGIENYLHEMEACLRRMFMGLRIGRYAVLVLGDAIFAGQEYQTAEMVGEVASKLGFEVVGIVERALPANKRSFICPARRLREEKMLVLRKPSKFINFKLYEPPYKLWGYEKVIRDLEVESLTGVSIKSDKHDDFTINASPLCADKLRRLTFIHGFFGHDYSQESTWQAILENGDAYTNQSNRKDPKYVTHGIHPYKGKFYPQLAKSLFNLAQLQPGHNILDCFCGSGTVILEGYLNGLNAKGLDLNPLAVEIAKAKTDILKVDPYVTDKVLTRFIEILEHIDVNEQNLKVFEPSCLDELASWFPSGVLKKIGWVIQAIEDIPESNIRRFLQVCLSSIVREVSQQDPKDLRIRRRKEPIEDAPIKELLKNKIDVQRTRLRHFSKYSNKAPNKFGDTHVFHADCRETSSYENAGIAPGSINGLITSPPYATALPYIDTDRLSILLLLSMKSKERSILEREIIGSREIANSQKAHLEEEIESNLYSIIESNTAQDTIKRVYSLNKASDVGFRRKNMASLLYRYFDDMTKTMKNIDRVMSTGGSMFFVIGDNRTIAGETELIIRSGKMIEETGCQLGWDLIKVIPITVTQENRLHNANSITENDIIWFKKAK